MTHLPDFCKGFILPRKQFEPAYLEAYRSGRLAEKVERVRAMLQRCRVCPRNCDLDRWNGQLGMCASGRYADVASYFPHFGEEDVLRGWRGSGTIFFGRCNLKCVFCLPPEAFVATDQGPLPIARIFEAGSDETPWHGGTVRFLDGRLHAWARHGAPVPITKAFRHPYEGELIWVKPYNCPPVLLTPNHEVFVVRVSDPDRPARLRADALSKGDYLIVPKRPIRGQDIVLDVASIIADAARPFRKSRRPRMAIEDLVPLLTQPLTSKELAGLTGYHPAYIRKLRGLWRNGGAWCMDMHQANTLVQEGERVRFKTEQRPGIPARLPLDESLAWLLGIYCAEGHVTAIRNRPNSYRIVFSFGRHESVLADRVADGLRRIFGVAPQLRWRRTTITVEIGKASLALLFRELCGFNAYTKRVPALLFQARPSVLRAFLQGVIDGDGYDQGQCYVVNTVSEELAIGLFELGLRLGMLPSYHRWQALPWKVLEDRRVRQSPLFYVKFPKGPRRRTKWKEREACFLVPIHKVERRPYRGWVFNLEVDDPDHSYAAPFIAVANCQNFDISRLNIGGVPTPPERLAEMMLELQARGCHNINLVTPEHVVPQIVEALPIAIERGLRLPIVYNTSAYDSLESLELMEGLVDIYMPDFKYWDPAKARKYLKAEDYPEAARRAILEMHRQVGDLVFDENGLALRGVLVRHLVMPGALDDTREILRWIAENLGRDTYVNIMDQYHPAGLVNETRYPELNRPITAEEYQTALRYAREFGLWRLDERWRRIWLRLAL